MTDFLTTALRKRRDEGLLRSLQQENKLIDFCSNDYLGFARNNTLRKKLKIIDGSTGSRLLTGNSTLIEKTESFIASYHHADAGLIYNTGYMANLGLFSCIAGRNDTILYDELSHASIRDGIRLSLARSFSFRHNNLTDLQSKLDKAKGNIFVAVESVYSMDGDFAPLPEIAALTEKYPANLIVDEAHATGIFGKKGEGRVCELGLEKKIFARVHTFGKALGCHGAIVLGSHELRDFLVNFSRPFIYTTAPSQNTLIAVRRAYQMLRSPKNKILKISSLIKLFESKFKDWRRIESSSPIQCILVPGNDDAKMLSLVLRKEGFDVRPILSPTVPKGKERLRICLHSFNTEKQVSDLCEIIQQSLKG